MGIRTAMEEAFQRGEKIKDQLIHDVMNSPAVGELLQNEVFLRSLSKVMNTKFEIQKALRTNLKAVLRMFNVPSRDELHTMERKIHRLESEIDNIHRRAMTEKVGQSHAHGPRRTPKKAAGRKHS